MANFKEEWKVIAKYPDYEISNKGEVYSRKSHKVLLGSSSSTGPLVTVSKEGRPYKLRIDMLVAQYFLGDEGDNNLVLHKDGDLFNNRVTNLRWCPAEDYQEEWADINRPKKRERKLTEDDISNILVWRIELAELAEIAETFKVSTSYISRICRANLDKHPARDENGNRVIRYWYKEYDPPARWIDGSVPVKVRRTD